MSVPLPARQSPRAALPDAGILLAWLLLALMAFAVYVLADAYLGSSASLARQCAAVGPNDHPACIGIMEGQH